MVPHAEIDALAGTWRLERFEITYSDGRAPSYPFGENAEGLLLYGADGWMSAVLSAPAREALDVGRLEAFGTASPARKLEAFESYLSYAGRWQIVDDRVIHQVELSMVPDIVGREQVRHFRFEGPTLVLTYEIEASSGVVRRYELRWRRVENKVME